MDNAHEYSCPGYIDGRACKHGIRVRRNALERSILDPVRRELLAPERVERMAKEMQAYSIASGRCNRGQKICRASFASLPRASSGCGSGRSKAIPTCPLTRFKRQSIGRARSVESLRRNNPLPSGTRRRFSQFAASSRDVSTAAQRRA